MKLYPAGRVEKHQFGELEKMQIFNTTEDVFSSFITNMAERLIQQISFSRHLTKDVQSIVVLTFAFLKMFGPLHDGYCVEL